MRKSSQSQNKLTLFLLSITSILLPVAIVNFIYDPGEIYLQKILTQRHVNTYVAALRNSEVGVRQFSNERLIKHQLAKYAADIDCVIIGSSHSMQVGTSRKPSSLSELCSNSLNLSTSGASIEDLLIFSNVLLANDKLPNKIIFEVSPWAMKWGMDGRYGIFYDDMSWMLQKLGLPVKKIPEPYVLKLLKNIINFEYFIQSLKSAYRKKLSVIPEDPFLDYKAVQEFDYDIGLHFPVTLNDGSHVYDKEYIEHNATTKEYIGIENYKLSGQYYDTETVNVFEKLVLHLQKAGIRIFILLTPYHHSIFKEENIKNYLYLTRMEEMLGNVAQKNNIAVFGSYNPQNIGCHENEFFDEMHPKMSCLNKIRFTYLIGDDRITYNSWLPTAPSML